MTTATTSTGVDRDEAAREIRAALRRRSGKPWSVTTGRGTSWGWITINVPPARRDRCGSMPDADRAELGELLGGIDAHHQGVLVPASSAYRREYIDRANGRPPVPAAPYWD